jgi:hypothetical protein
MGYAIWYDLELRCEGCEHRVARGGMYTHGILLDPGDEWAELGRTFSDDQLDLDGAFARVSGTGTSTVRALETWGCPACGRLHLAVVTWAPVHDGHRLDAVEGFHGGEDVRRITHVSHRALEELAGRRDLEALLAELRPVA